MAIIRVTGGKGGIREYLDKGNKSGRTHSRDELDERVFLCGDIDLMDSIINSIKADRVKYTHVTISLKEDIRDPEIFRKMLDDYRNFIFAAYDKSEYHLYAEVHMPLIKSYIDANGNKVYRKPHMHLIAPNVNLLSGAALNPWGVYKHNERFFDAFQEKLNMIHGTISPALSRRRNFTSESTILERSKGDYFLGRKDALKQSILENIVAEDLSSMAALEDSLRKRGEVTIRNSGKANAYLAFKPQGAETFTNLRQYVFSEQFLGLSAAEKQESLRTEGRQSYISLGAAQNVPDKLEEIIKEWHTIRSKQIKYLGGNIPARYKSFTNEEKTAFLAEKESAFYKKYGATAGFEPPSYQVGEPQPIILKPPVPAMAPASTGPKACNAIAQFVHEQANALSKVSHEDNALVPRWNREIDLSFLLSQLVFSHGLIREKYQIRGQELPGDAPIPPYRIRCGSYHLPASDFLTDEMRMPWPVAFGYLKECIEQQSTLLPNIHAEVGQPDPVLWRRFKAVRTQIRKALRDEYQRCLEQLETSLPGEKYGIDLRRSYERFTLFQIKMPKVMRDLLLANLDAAHYQAKVQMNADLQISRQRMRRHRIVISDWSLYLAYLHENASTDFKCLVELRKHATAHVAKPNSLYIIGADNAPIIEVAELKLIGIRRRIKENGDVVYVKDEIELVHDEGGRLLINADEGSAAITAALALANAKWKTDFSIDGPPDLRRAASALVSMFRADNSTHSSMSGARLADTERGTRSSEANVMSTDIVRRRR